eukprot:g3164.t1
MHPERKKQVRINGQLREENRWSMFYSRGVGYFKYAGLRNEAVDIEPGSPVEHFLRLTHELMNSTTMPQNQIESRDEADDHPSSSSGARALLSPAANCCSHNSVLVNWYLPEHKIGSHSDDESQHMPFPIFSYSLSPGGARRFLFHSKRGGAAVKDLTLKDGDLLVMGGTMQQNFKHSVPPLRKNETFGKVNRINLTVRALRKMEQ